MLPWIEVDRDRRPGRARRGAEHGAAGAELAVGSDRCLGRRCARVSTCFAEGARQRAAQADLVIANHALYFADLALREGGDGARVLPEHDAVVFDEAHKLEESAASWLGGADHRRGRAPPGDRRGTGGLPRLASPCHRERRRASRRRRSGAPAPRRPAKSVAAASGSCRARRRLVLIDELERVAQAACGQERRAGRASQSALAGSPRDVGTCLEPPTPNVVVWAEPGVLAYAPIDVSERLRDSLWAEGPTAILVSATLEHGFVERRLGLEHADRFDAGLAVRLPRRRRSSTVPQRLREPRERARSRSRSRRSAWLSRGRALVLTTSLPDARTSWRGGCASGCRTRCSSRARRRASACSSASGTRRTPCSWPPSTFWQGVDVAGESLSLLVMRQAAVRLAGRPARPRRAASGSSEQGGDWFRDYALPVATLQLRQGFGRLDPRACRPRRRRRSSTPGSARARYGEHLLEALPSCPLVDDLAEVERFFADDEVSGGATPSTYGADVIVSSDEAWKPCSHVGDLEARRLDRGERVAGGVTTAERTRPEQRVAGALERSERGSRRAHVLPEAELAAGLEHAAQLGQGRGGFRHAAEDAHHDGHVECPVLRGQRLGDSLDHLDRNHRAPRPLGGVLPRGRVRLDGEHARRAGRVVLERTAVA